MSYDGASGLSLQLSSGSWINVREILLYPRLEIDQIAALRAQAEEQLGGFSSGIGFLGSPGAVLGGMAAVGAMEAVVSGKKEKKGMQLLRDAHAKNESVRKRARYFGIEGILGIETPYPAAWSASGEGMTAIDLNLMKLLEKGDAINRYAIKRDDIDNGVATFEAEIDFVHDGSTFIWIGTDNGRMGIRWDSVVAYSPG